MTTALQIMTLFQISYGQVASASQHQISKSSVYRVANGVAPYNPRQLEAFTGALAVCIQARADHLDSAYLFKPALEPSAIEQEPLKLTA